MRDTYRPKSYWEQRLGRHFSLRGVGHLKYSRSYNDWMYRRKRRCIESVFEGRSLAGRRVLDVGCGTGFFVDWYLQQGARVTGLDITEVSARTLSERFGDRATFRVGDIAGADYEPPGEFDVVNMWDVAYHIVEPEAFDRALDNLCASLAPEGTLLLTDWFGASTDRTLAPHVRVRCLATYQHGLQRRDLDLVGVKPLYRALNKRHLSRLDNLLAGFYYYLDTRLDTIPKDNLSLGIWRRDKVKPTSGAP